MVCSHQIVPATPGNTVSLLWTKGEQVEEAEVALELGLIAEVPEVRIVRLHDGICARPASVSTSIAPPPVPLDEVCRNVSDVDMRPRELRPSLETIRARRKVGRRGRRRVWVADFLGLCSVVINARAGSGGGPVGEPYFGSDVPRDSCCRSPEPDRKPRVNTSAPLSFRDSRCCCTRLANESQLTVRGWSIMGVSGPRGGTGPTKWAGWQGKYGRMRNIK